MIRRSTGQPDVIDTYRFWLQHELLRGRLDQRQFEFSERDVGGLLDVTRDRIAE